jgi:hypothetical protein
MTEPTYEMFAKRSARGVKDFLRNLTVGVPEPVPEQFNVTSVRSACPVIGKELGCKIALRAVDGQMWACRLKPEDVK